MNATQLRKLVIRPVLEYLGSWSQAAENLLLGTAAQESHVGQYIAQLGGGPALGIYQMEPETFYDIVNNFLDYRPGLRKTVARLGGVGGFAIHGHYPPNNDFPAAEELIGNAFFATAMARIHYLRAPFPLPDADDVEGLAAYWKRIYNTPAGKGTVEEFRGNYYHRIVEA